MMKRREFITLLGGAVAAWPIAVHAQQGERVPLIAFLLGSTESDPNVQTWISALGGGLEALGWKDGRNVRFEHRFAAGDTARGQKFAKELVQLNPDVIVTASTPTATALLQETRTIPIVFTNLADPLGSGLVSSLAHPGGNATGFTNFEFGIGGKWVDILRDIVPNISRTSIIFNPAAAPFSGGFIRSFDAAARSFAVQPIVAPVNDVAGIEDAISTQSREPGGSVIVLMDIFTVTNRMPIITSSVRHRVPVVYPYRVMAIDGGLVAYGPDIPDLFRRAAAYVDRVLRGAKPGDLPSSSRPSTNWSSTSGLRRRSASQCRHRCSRAPTR
jgi:putative tryptophan/tyrosine transport system substrate-binding protein